MSSSRSKIRRHHDEGRSWPLIDFWLSEVLVATAGAVVLTLVSIGIFVALSGLRLPSLGLIGHLFLICWLPFAAFAAVRVPSKLRAWRRFRRLPAQDRTLGRAAALVEEERKRAATGGGV